MSAADAEQAVNSLCREAFSALALRGAVHAAPFLDELQIEYVAPPSSGDPHEATYVKLSWHEEDRELWIRQLRVAGCLRRRGIGRKLVAASEQLARRLCAHRIHVFPLRRAWGFWCGLGYRPHANLSRVLTKACPTD